jgi:hypothetical protein
MFSSEHNKLDMFEAMQGGKVVLVNTSKALLKTDASALFGRLPSSAMRASGLSASACTGPCGDAPKAARNQEQRTLILECSHPKSVLAPFDLSGRFESCGGAFCRNRAL